MLEHQKIVLNGVKDNEYLFSKELKKSLAWLNSHELTQLRKWLKENFWDTHKTIIQDILYPSYEYAE